MFVVDETDDVYWKKTRSVYIERRMTIDKGKRSRESSSPLGTRDTKKGNTIDSYPQRESKQKTVVRSKARIDEQLIIDRKERKEYTSKSIYTYMYISTDEKRIRG